MRYNVKQDLTEQGGKIDIMALLIASRKANSIRNQTTARKILTSECSSSQVHKMLPFHKAIVRDSRAPKRMCLGYENRSLHVGWCTASYRGGGVTSSICDELERFHVGVVVQTIFNALRANQCRNGG